MVEDRPHFKLQKLTALLKSVRVGTRVFKFQIDFIELEQDAGVDSDFRHALELIQVQLIGKCAFNGLLILD